MPQTEKQRKFLIKGGFKIESSSHIKRLNIVAAEQPELRAFSNTCGRKKRPALIFLELRTRLFASPSSTPGIRVFIFELTFTLNMLLVLTLYHCPSYTTVLDTNFRLSFPLYIVNRLN